DSAARVVIVIAIVVCSQEQVVLDAPSIELAQHVDVERISNPVETLRQSYLTSLEHAGQDAQVDVCIGGEIPKITATLLVGDGGIEHGIHLPMLVEQVGER